MVKDMLDVTFGLRNFPGEVFRINYSFGHKDVLCGGASDGSEDRITSHHVQVLRGGEFVDMLRCSTDELGPHVV